MFFLVSLVELIQTEVHHVQTLHIMERVFRQGMLDELQLSPSVVHALFPCLDQLTRIHAHFVDQLLLRRNNSLQPGSGHNFTIRQLGDILLEQVICSQIPGVSARRHSNVMYIDETDINILYSNFLLSQVSTKDNAYARVHIDPDNTKPKV